MNSGRLIDTVFTNETNEQDVGLMMTGVKVRGVDHESTI
jgi:hypothetical protein